MTAPFLRLLPAALLFWTLPAAVGAWRLIAGFRRIAEMQVGGTMVPIRLSMGVAGLLWLGTLVVLTAAVGLMLWERSLRLEPDRPGSGVGGDVPSVPSASGAPAWHAPVLIASSLAVIPAGLAMYCAFSVTTLLPSAAMAISVGRALGAEPDFDLMALSRVISARLIIATGLGGLTSLGLVALTLVNVFLMRPAPAMTLLPRYSRVAAGLVTAAAAIALISIGAHLVRLFRA
jgi:hypothetical protein